MRTLTAAMTTAVAGESIEPICLMHGAFLSGDVRLWTGYGDLTWGADTFTGAGTLIGWPQISENAQGEVAGISITLAGVDPDNLSLAMDEHYQSRALKVWFGALRRGGADYFSEVRTSDADWITGTLDGVEASAGSLRLSANLLMTDGPDGTNLSQWSHNASEVTGPGVAEGDWYRVTHVSGSSGGGQGVRGYVDEAALLDGETYTVSVEAWNDGASAVTISMDWCDENVTQTVIAAGAQQRVYVSASRATYDATYRFFDICPQEDGASILLRHPQVTYGSAQLVDHAAENLLLRSEDLTNAAWVNSGTTETADATTAPDGTITADKLVDDTSTGAHQTSQTVTVAAGQTYCGSVFAKAGELDEFSLRVRSPGDGFGVQFNLTNGTATPFGDFGSGSRTDYGIDSLPGGWYRCWVCGIPSTTDTNISHEIRTRLGGVEAHTGDGTSGLYLWGAQLVPGIEPGVYTATAASAVTDTPAYGKFDAAGLPTAGTRSATLDLSAAGVYADSSISWTATEPTGTTVTVDVSHDAGLTWLACTSGAEIPGFSAGQALTSVQLRQSLSTTDPIASPTLADLTLTINPPLYASAPRLVEEPVLIFDGLMDMMPIDDDAERPSISLTGESRLLGAVRGLIWRYTNEDQQALHAGDQGFEFVEQLQTQAFTWGR